MMGSRDVSPPASFRSTKITTAEQPLAQNAGTYPPTKNITLHPKTARCYHDITKKSIPIPPDGQPANQKTIIPQKLSHRSESSEPHVRLPSLGVQPEVECPEDLALKARRV